jgi:hypothetical protein
MSTQCCNYKVYEKGGNKEGKAFINLPKICKLAGKEFSLQFVVNLCA